MDQKRALWIIAATGVFLLVVLGSAFLLYTPSPRTTRQVAALETAKVQPASQTAQKTSGWTQSNDTLRANELTVYSDKTVVYGKDNNETTIDLNALRSELEKAQAPQNINITLNVPETKSEPVPPAQLTAETKITVEAPVKEEVRVEKTVVKAEPKSAPKTEVKVKADPKPVTKTEAKPAAKKAEPKPAAEPVKYWIQAAAFSTKKSAENARAKLDESKIPADIFTYTDANGKTFYRVRVGPYTTKSEAEYWKSKIVKINEFKEGYITTK